MTTETSKTNEVELISSIAPRAAATQPFRVVLHKMNGGWVTHMENLIEDGHGYYKSKPPQDFYWGHYFESDYKAAHDDFWKRAGKYNL